MEKVILTRIWQVGIMLNDFTIDNMVIGGPAYKCKQLDRGDIIQKIDGVPVTEDNLKAALIGDDLPGSSISLTVQKGQGPEVFLFHERACVYSLSL
jgi:C-terminal processing protease CtpA/Prc